MTLSRGRPLLIVLGTAAAALALAGGSSQGAAARAQTPLPVRVTERDFHISAPAQLASGNVALLVHNEGPDAHELIVAPMQGSRALPLRSDGYTVNEEALQSAIAGSLEPGAPGSMRELRLHLRPGRYVFFCNMSGHYMGGMHTEVTVR